MAFDRNRICTLALAVVSTLLAALLSKAEHDKRVLRQQLEVTVAPPASDAETIADEFASTSSIEVAPHNVESIDDSTNLAVDVVRRHGLEYPGTIVLDRLVVGRRAKEGAPDLYQSIGVTPDSIDDVWSYYYPATASYNCISMPFGNEWASALYTEDSFEPRTSGGTVTERPVTVRVLMTEPPTRIVIVSRSEQEDFTHVIVLAEGREDSLSPVE